MTVGRVVAVGRGAWVGKGVEVGAGVAVGVGAGVFVGTGVGEGGTIIGVGVMVGSGSEVAGTGVKVGIGVGAKLFPIGVAVIRSLLSPQPANKTVNSARSRNSLNPFDISVFFAPYDKGQTFNRPAIFLIENEIVIGILQLKFGAV